MHNLHCHQALSRLIINALSRHTMSIFSTYLLMPPIMQSQDNHVSQFTTRSSPHMEEFSQLQWQSQLTPSPQGFSSLPRVSEAFTPNTTINPQQQLKKIKPNANRFNMLTHNTNNSNIFQMQPHRFLQAHSYTSIFNFHEMRENMAWSTNLLSNWWLCKNGDEDLPSMASKSPSQSLRCLYN